MPKVIHFEIPAEDLDRSKSFYSAVFGWRLQAMDMPGGQYVSVVTTPVDEQTQMPTEPGAINGGMFQRTDTTPTPVITVDVESIDDALREIEAHGGSTVAPRVAIPDMGAFAYFKDPEGNVMGLWETTS